MVAQTILNQIGGNHFIAITGSKNFMSMDNGLRMNLAKNLSGANMLKITLNANDYYDMEFTRYTPFHFSVKTGKITDEKIEVIKSLEDVPCDMLAEIFTATTGLYTKLF